MELPKLVKNKIECTFECRICTHGFGVLSIIQTHEMQKYINMTYLQCWLRAAEAAKHHHLWWWVATSIVRPTLFKASRAYPEKLRTRGLVVGSSGPHLTFYNVWVSTPVVIIICSMFFSGGGYKEFVCSAEGISLMVIEQLLIRSGTWDCCMNLLHFVAVIEKDAIDHVDNINFWFH